MRSGLPNVGPPGLALVALACILAVLLAPVPPPAWLCLGPLALLPAARRWPLSQVVVLAGLAAALAAVAVERRLADRPAAALQDTVLHLDGRIASLPEPVLVGSDPARARPGGWRFVFEPAPRQPGVPTRLRLVWYTRAAAPAAAETWHLTVRLRPPRGHLNPGGFDHEAWAFAHHIGATGSVRAGERRAPAAGGLLALRGRIARAVAEACGARPSCAVVQGLAVGHAGAIPTQTWRAYRDTGTLHLVAISGLHVTLLALGAWLVVHALWARWPAACLRLPAPRAAALVALGVASLYALLAGFGVPARRTLAMLAVAALFTWLGRATTPVRVLAWALLVVLATDPFAALAPGFWLSFAGVALLMWVGRGAHPAWRAVLRSQWAATLGLAPLLASAFGSVPVTGLVANLIAIPVFNLVAVPAAVVGAVLVPLLPGVAAGCFDVAAVALAALDPVLLALAEAAPGLGLAAPTWPALVSAGLGVALALAPRGLPGRLLAPVLCLPLVLPVLARPPAGDFVLTVLDVGQGLATLVETRHHSLVFDAGPGWGADDAGATVVGPSLTALGRRPDLLVVSHADSDHAGGVASLRRRWPGLAVLAGEDHPRIGPALTCRAGQTWTWDGVRFVVLHPAAAATGNAASCLLSVQGRGGAALLTGDLPASAERALLAQDLLTPHAVLVSPHHGSQGSSTPAFVARVAPRVVVHAAGYANRWDFPRPPVVARYARAGAAQWTTGEDGAVRVTVAAEAALRVEAWRARRAAVWRAR